MSARILCRSAVRTLPLYELEPVRREKLIEIVIVYAWWGRGGCWGGLPEPHRQRHLGVVMLHLLRDLGDVLSIGLIPPAGGGVP